MTKRILIPFADGFEELEAATISDLLVRAGAEVIRAGIKPGPVKAARGMTILPETTLAEIAGVSFDMIVLPGGQPGADNLMASNELKLIMDKHVHQKKWLGAICAAPRVLVNHQYVKDHAITSYPGALNQFDTKGLQLKTDAVVISGHIVTSTGPSTAMEFALTLIEILYSQEKRLEVEKALNG